MLSVGAQVPECLQSTVHDGGWGEAGSPEIHKRVQLQVVKSAPDSQLLNLAFISRLVTVQDEADDCSVVHKL